jgi:hypothetical protein
MAVDRYTKVVLTVIAACLVWLSVGGPSLITPVKAQSDRVYLAGWIDEKGASRQFPIPPGTGIAEPGRPVTPTPLPIWQWNR